MFIKSNCESFTGRFLYSDCYGQPMEQDFGMTLTIEGKKQEFADKKSIRMPLLNKIAEIPVVGIVAGIARFVLAIFHTLGHLFAAIRNKGHLAHSLKGCSEMLRGLIEMIPVVGRMFAWNMKASPLPYLSHEYFASFFLVKVYNPKKIDATDAVFALYKAHPFLSVPETGKMCGGVEYRTTSIKNKYEEIKEQFKPEITGFYLIQRQFSHKTTQLVDSEIVRKYLDK